MFKWLQHVLWISFHNKQWLTCFFLIYGKTILWRNKTYCINQNEPNEGKISQFLIVIALIVVALTIWLIFSEFLTSSNIRNRCVFIVLRMAEEQEMSALEKKVAEQIEVRCARTVKGEPTELNWRMIRSFDSGLSTITSAPDWRPDMSVKHL